MAIDVRRRKFIAVLSSALIGRAIPAYAQQAARTYTVRVLLGLANDVETQGRITAFERGLEAEGWSVGKSLWIEYRFAGGDSNAMRAFAKELAELKPDCILGHSTPVVRALMQATRTIPIVFVSVSDPIGSGFVAYGTTWRQHDWVHDLSGHHYRQTPIDAERNGTAARPRSHHLQSGFRASRGHILFDSIH